MLTIRTEQHDKLAKYALRQFKQRLFAEAKKNWPEQCEAMGKKAVEGQISNGIESAKSYSITSESDIARYVNLIFIWGEGFDHSPRTPWAAGILNDLTLSGPIKVHQLVYRTKLQLGGK